MDAGRQTLPAQVKLLLCPVSRCAGTMLLKSHAASPYDPFTGLETLVCACCGYWGLRAHDGLKVLFSDRREYCFSYGPSLVTLVIILSSEALNLFAGSKWSAAQLATYLAEWTLLTGRTEGTLRFALETPALSDCCEYFRLQMETGISLQAA